MPPGQLALAFQTHRQAEFRVLAYCCSANTLFAMIFVAEPSHCHKLPIDMLSNRNGQPLGNTHFLDGNLVKCLKENGRCCLGGPKPARTATKLGMGVHLSGLKALCVGNWAGVGGWVSAGRPCADFALV